MLAVGVLEHHVVSEDRTTERLVHQRPVMDADDARDVGLPKCGNELSQLPWRVRLQSRCARKMRSTSLPQEAVPATRLQWAHVRPNPWNDSQTAISPASRNKRNSRPGESWAPIVASPGLTWRRH